MILSSLYEHCTHKDNFIYSFSIFYYFISHFTNIIILKFYILILFPININIKILFPININIKYYILDSMVLF